MPSFLKVAVIVMLCGVVSVAQMPVAQLPSSYIDTTYRAPSGTTWLAHNASQLASALKTSQPGDIIMLDAGVIYSGNFTLPAKANSSNQWIYIVSSALTKLPAGRRVAKADSVNMPKIVTPNSNTAVILAAGANHFRLVGIEIYTSSTYVPTPSVSPNGFTYYLVGPPSHPTPLPDSIVIDRCYIHGSPTEDVKQAIQGNGTRFAVIDSYISDIHAPGADTQAFLAYDTPGPIKVVNNYLEAAGENIMFGGSGGNNNRGVPSDIEVRNNYLYKPLAWAKAGLGGTLPPNNQWVEKNAFELKSAQRVLFDSNTIENVWAAAQTGFAILLTVRTSQSGDFAVVNDITITNNVLKNVAGGFSTLAADDTCATSGYPNCKNAGSQDRWYIANNLITFYDPSLPGGYRNVVMMVNPGLDRINGVQGMLRDVVFQHNTAIPSASGACWSSIYFSTGSQKPPFNNLTYNMWFLDNNFCRQPTGDWGLQGTTGLTQYMGSPAGVDARYRGNVMSVLSGDKTQTFPVHNYASTVPFTYVAPQAGDYQLATPYWTDTSDGRISGIDYSRLSQTPSAASLLQASVRR